jgi:hypothetical protein
LVKLPEPSHAWDVPLTVWGEVALIVLFIGVHPVVDQVVDPWIKLIEVNPLLRPNPKLPGNPVWTKLKPDASETETSIMPLPKSVRVTVLELLVPQPPVQSSEV